MAPAADENRPALPDGVEGPTIQAMFGRIAHRYDLANHVLSLGMDFAWWRRMALEAAAAPGKRILDVASGTGDSALALARCGATVVASDFTLPMLAIGQEKLKASAPKGLFMGAVGADARSLPFADSTFDAVTICYGIRNLQDRASAFSEFIRVLRPGSRLVVLEFSRPRPALLRWLYGAYSRTLLPLVGGWISGDRAAYRYLPLSIRDFPPQERLADELEDAGFVDVRWRNLCFGVVAIHVGWRQ